MPQRYLKRRVNLYAGLFVAASVLAFVWVGIGAPVVPTEFYGLLVDGLPKSMISAIVALVASALGSIPGHEWKARIVYHRAKDPLPGSRAFTRTTLTSDPRIDVDALKRALGGSFPKGAKEQNSIWFALYMKLQADARVDGIHFEYLLYRDLTWLALILLSISFFSMLLISAQRGGFLILACVFLLLFLLFRRAASERGNRLVTTVLALSTTTNQASHHRHK